MSARTSARPHTARPKPQRCPDCHQTYQYRYREQLDQYSIYGYRHHHQGWVYVHQIDHQRQTDWGLGGGEE